MALLCGASKVKRRFVFVRSCFYLALHLIAGGTCLVIVAVVMKLVIYLVCGEW